MTDVNDIPGGADVGGVCGAGCIEILEVNGGIICSSGDCKSGRGGPMLVRGLSCCRGCGGPARPAIPRGAPTPGGGRPPGLGGGNTVLVGPGLDPGPGPGGSGDHGDDGCAVERGDGRCCVALSRFGPAVGRAGPETARWRCRSLSTESSRGLEPGSGTVDCASGEDGAEF